jgi:hypothetical protein
VICELVDCLNPGQRLVQLEAHSRVATCVEEEGGVLHRQVDMVVVGELREGE